jgi:uncharacterized membrane protein
MEPALAVTLLWLLFGGTHIGLATGPVRATLVDRLEERGFTALFSAVAAASFTLLVAYYAGHRFAGAPGLALGTVPALRWVLMAVVVGGVALMAAALVIYPRTPMAIFTQTVRPPHGIERVTRHPFFVGLALVALAHTLLATRLVGTVFMAGFAVVALAGAWHQDRKLLGLRGRPYADYMAATSLLPFGAILAGRQRVVWPEFPVGALAAGVAIALALRAVHGAIFDHGGAWVIGTTVGGAAVASFQSWRRARRARAREVQVVA